MKAERFPPFGQTGRMGEWVKWSAIRTGLRDVVFLGLGSFVIIQQVQGPPERVSILLITAGLIILGVPGSIGLLSLFRGNEPNQDTQSSPSRHRQVSSS